MIRKLFIGDSKLQGTGLFAGEDIKKGDVVMIWSMNCFIISEKDYNEEQRKGNSIMIKTGARFIDGIFLYTDSTPRLENYVNHSFTPNMLYHCGICFAKKDIAAGEEVTIDYKYVLAKGDVARFIDSSTGRDVDGLTSIECIKESTKELFDIVNSLK